MTSRERVVRSLNHEEPDRVPVDLGGSVVSGMHVSSVYKLRRALGMDTSGTPVKVVETYQMLGEIKPDLGARLGVDVVGLNPPRTFFGYPNSGWKEWELFNGTPVLVPGKFNTVPETNGDILMYPEGDRSAPPSGRMPQGGFYFDSVVRQPPIIEEQLDPNDNLEEFGPISDGDLAYFQEEAERLSRDTDKAILANFGGTGFGDIALIPAPWLKSPKGIRDIAEWYMSTVARRDYVYKVFEGQCSLALDNLEKIYSVVGDRIQIIFVSGTDFGMQTGSFISPDAYRDLYKPFHSQVNRWIHGNTSWKSFIHTCGSVRKLLPDMIEAGFDILNPVQCSADGMEASGLKRDFGAQIVFWGGGSDTQKTLPFGEPGEVRQEVKQRMASFRHNGGYLFGAIHNIQAGVPIENLMALFEAVEKERGG